MAILGGALLSAGTASIAAGTFVFSTFATNFALSLALGAAMKALTPKPSVSGSDRGYQTNSIGPAQDHQIIYGKVKVGGAIVYDETTGVNNKLLHRIIAIAGHEVESFDKFYFNDEEITIDSNGEVTSPSQYVGKIRVNTHLGSPTQAADTDLVAESNKWTDQHRLQGIAYLYVRLKFDADAFPNGIPTITAVVSGKKVYDPRSGLTAWSSNPALCVRDYLTSKYGIEEYATNIDDVLISTAANICDQTNTIAGDTRYTCNGAFTTASTPYDMISELLKSMGGTLWYAQGKWRVKPAYWTPTVMNLNLDDLRSSISVSTRHSRRDNFNVIKGTFRGEESNWQVTDYPQVTNSAFLVADNNQESVADVDLTFTDNSVESRRLGLISLERNRQQLTVNASFGLRTLELQVGDNVTVTNPRFGWTNKEFEVVQWSFGLTNDLDLQTQMTLRETAESVFDEVSDGVVYERDNTELLSAFLVPVIGMSTSVRTDVIREKLTNVITLTTLSSQSERIDYVEAEFKLSSSITWITLGTGSLGDFEALDLQDGSYDFRSRAINTFGVKGDWSELNNINASGLLEPPSDIVNLFAEVNGAIITLDWDAVPDLDLSFYRVRHSPSVSGATWGNSTTYVDKVSRPASSVSVPAKSGTYILRAYDKSGVGSLNTTEVVVPVANIETFTNSLTLTDSPTFSGVKSNTEVLSLQLRLTDYTSAPSVGEYTMSNYIESSSSQVVRCRVRLDVTTERHNNTAGLFDDNVGLFDEAVGLFDSAGGNSNTADTNVVTYVSHTQDDPSGTPTWSAYSPIKVTDISARAFRFKVQLQSSSNNISPAITALTAYVEHN